MCGLPLAPLPWLAMWEMSMEEREEKETWERTQWTWTDDAAAGCDDKERTTQEWVKETRHLPQIVTDHGSARVSRSPKPHRKARTSFVQDKEFRPFHAAKVADDCKDSFIFSAYKSLELLNQVTRKHQYEIPVKIEGIGGEAEEDDEMEDYYENHKAWPTRSS